MVLSSRAAIGSFVTLIQNLLYGKHSPSAAGLSQVPCHAALVLLLVVGTSGIGLRKNIASEL
jgi:hypothetical protein